MGRTGLGCCKNFFIPNHHLSIRRAEFGPGGQLGIAALFIKQRSGAAGHSLGQPDLRGSFAGLLGRRFAMAQTGADQRFRIIFAIAPYRRLANAGVRHRHRAVVTGVVGAAAR